MSVRIDTKQINLIVLYYLVGSNRSANCVIPSHLCNPTPFPSTNRISAKLGLMTGFSPRPVGIEPCARLGLSAATTISDLLWAREMCFVVNIHVKKEVTNASNPASPSHRESVLGLLDVRVEY